jgi:hypothetical protein
LPRPKPREWQTDDAAEFREEYGRRTLLNKDFEEKLVSCIIKWVKIVKKSVNQTKNAIKQRVNVL